MLMIAPSVVVVVLPPDYRLCTSHAAAATPKLQKTELSASASKVFQTKKYLKYNAGKRNQLLFSYPSHTGQERRSRARHNNSH
jgi:hypothetical protein